MQAGRLLPGMQYNALRAVSQLLGSVPEGRDASHLISQALEGISDRIESVPEPVLVAVYQAIPILDRVTAGTLGDAESEAHRKIQMIVRHIGSSTGISQTLLAVDAPKAIERAASQIYRVRSRIESPALRYLQERRDGMDGDARLPAFQLNGKWVHRGKLADLLAILSRHFGGDVSENSLRRLFCLDQTDYRIASVGVLQDAGHLRITGEIRHDQEVGGYFGMIIPPVPESGTPWVAKVEAINVIKNRTGIGSHLLFRVALFLHEMGVHAMEANAMEAAGLFCVFNGFRVGKSLYEEIVAEFVGHLEEKGIPVSESRLRTHLLDRDSNLAELAAFEIDGHRVGRDFLNALFHRKYLPVKFELSADKQSWLRLLSNLNRSEKNIVIVPTEWQPKTEAWPGLSAGVRSLLMGGLTLVGGNVLHLMSSDRDHAIHLVERLNNWAQGVGMFMDFPPELIDRLPAERRAMTNQQKTAIQEVLAMLESYADSNLFAHVQDLLDPNSEGGVGQTNHRGIGLARTLLSAHQKQFLVIPPLFVHLFEELLSSDD